MKLALTPLDTLFFRDSTPFDQGSSSQDGVPSVFPPSPSTVTGALRAALARARGWNGRDPWSAALIAALGDGPDVGPLRATGPFVLCGGAPVFPLPRHVVAMREARDDSATPVWRATGWRAPGPKVTCDLGDVRLPKLRAAGDAAGSTSAAVDKASRGGSPWVTLAGLQQILDGQLPAPGELMDATALWSSEPRVGLRRASESRTAEPGMLYSTRHVRLKTGVQLAVELAGAPSDWPSLGDRHDGRPCTLALGGESRLASVEPWRGERRGIPITDGMRHARRLTLVALTPLRLERSAIAGKVPIVPGLRVACACTDRMLRIGGWDARTRTPLPLANAVAPGAVLFCEASDDAPSTPDFDIDRGLIRVGRDISTGFGLCAVAREPWEEIT